MTVQELINTLNKVEDKSKRIIFHPNGGDTEYDMQEFDNIVILY